MGIINTSHFSWDLLPVAKHWYGQRYAELAIQFTELFNKSTSTAAFEERAGTAGFGFARKKDQGDAIYFDDNRQTFLARYVHVTYGLGFSITREMYRDGQAVIKTIANSKALAFSLRQTKEVMGANVYNRGFTAAYTMGAYHDGKPLFATDHPNVSGGSWSNMYDGGADLSEYALDQVLIQIGNIKTDKGMRIAVKAERLIVPPALESEAARQLLSDGRTGTDYNDINYIKKTGKFPKGYFVANYLDDDDAWFVKTNCPDGMEFIEREADEFDADNDFLTRNANFLGMFRCSFGWTDPRGVVGVEGL